MEPIDRLITAAVYLTVGVAVGVAALVLFRYYGGGGVMAGPAEVVDGGQRTERADSDRTGFSRGAHIEQVFAQRAQIKRLQDLLDQKNLLLEKKTTLLDEKTSEQAALRKELDQAIDMLDMMAEQVFAESTDPSDRDKEPLQTEMERLRTDSDNRRATAEQQQAEMELLMMELAATDEEILQLERESESEVNALIEEREAFESVVSGAFAQMGREAVPILAGFLRFPQPSIRRWAATTLGEIGPLAREAIPPLIDAGQDLDPGVREAARSALTKVDVPGEMDMPGDVDQPQQE
jgi:hypothetical protein